jgi:hypothetical protein
MSEPRRFDPASIGQFRMTQRSFDPSTRTVSLHYAFDDGPEFVETVTFETAPTWEPAVGTAGFERALLHLHIAAGTSYYKVAAPYDVVVEGEGLARSELAFHHHLYDDGLREFAVANRLAVPQQVSIRCGEPRAPGGPPGLSTRPGGSSCPSEAARTRWC